ncbi:S24 family peptidase, partial [Endozoicomonas sp.]|uniref:S24 family peptidase n=1 Tax=Endozoicomonas sp. TaxID=1892382 RepID=UPI00383BDBB3
NVNRILKSTTPPSQKILLKLAAAFKLPIEALQISAAAPQFLSVPVLTKDLLDTWLTNPASVDTCGLNWVPALYSTGNKLFAYSLNHTDSQPGCPTGSIVVIDPDKEMITGHKILCRLTDGRTMVRQLQHASDSWFLSPLQPQLPLIEVGTVQSFTYLGTIISTVISESLI